MHLGHQDEYRPVLWSIYRKSFPDDLFMKKVFHKGQTEKITHTWLPEARSICWVGRSRLCRVYRLEAHHEGSWVLATIPIGAHLRIS
jgi:hypothetical protein